MTKRGAGLDSDARNAAKHQKRLSKKLLPGNSGSGQKKRLGLDDHALLLILEMFLQLVAAKKDIQMFKRLSQVPTQTWCIPDAPPCTFCSTMRYPTECAGFCCQEGKISIDLPRMPDELWRLYVSDMTPQGIEFRRRCRSYNNTMAFTSIQITYDTHLASSRKGVYTLRVNGQLRHYIHDFNKAESKQRHMELYFYGTEAPLSERFSVDSDLEVSILRRLTAVLEVNPYNNFFSNIDNMAVPETHSIVLRKNPELDKRVYNLPVVDHAAAIWNEFTSLPLDDPRDIKVNSKGGGVTWIHFYYGCYDPLQYVLLFPFREPGWRAGLPKRVSGATVRLVDEDRLDAAILDVREHELPERCSLQSKQICWRTSLNNCQSQCESSIDTCSSFGQQMSQTF